MKARVLGAVVGVAAVLSGLLVASPAQAIDGPDSVRVYYPGTSGSGGYARADIDFVSRTDVVYRNFTVRDVCPGDGRPVRAHITWWGADGIRRSIGPLMADTNGCGPDGTNFGTIRLSAGSTVARANLTVCVYTVSGGNLGCATSAGRDNPYH